MRKTLGSLCALVLVVGVMVAVQRSSHAAPLTHPQVPKIIAKVALTGQTAAIPTTTIFTPTQTGLYRISAYLTVTQPGTGSDAWNLYLGWADAAGSELFTSNIAAIQNNATPPNAYVNNVYGPGDTMIIEAVVGTPVTYQVFTSFPSGTYSLYITAELLE